MKKTFSKILAVFLAMLMVVTATPVAFASDNIGSSTVGEAACSHSHNDFDGICDICGAESGIPSVNIGETYQADIINVDGKETRYIVKFVAPETGEYIIQSNSEEIDPLVYAYVDIESDYVGSSDDYEDRNFRYIFDIEKGDTIYFSLEEYNDEEGTYEFFIEKYIEIVQQPSSGYPTAELNWDIEATYQWYEAAFSEAELTDQDVAALEADGFAKSTYNSDTGWYCVNSGGCGYLFAVETEKRDILTFTPSEEIGYVELYNVQQEYYYYPEYDDGAYSITIEEDGTYKVYIVFTADDTEGGNFYITQAKVDLTELAGETTATIQNPEIGKNYLCVVCCNDQVFETECFEYVYAITHQPTKEECYVETNAGNDATYQWYYVDETYEEITDAMAASYEDEETTYDPELGWTSVDIGDGTADYCYVALEEGDVIAIQSSEPREFFNIWDYENGTNASEEVDDETTATMQASYSGIFAVYSNYVDDGNHIKVYKVTTEYVPVEGQTTNTLSVRENGEYLCKAAFPDGTTEKSRRVEIELESGWNLNATGWFYIDANGSVVTSQWMQDSVGWCYIGADGYMLTNSWVMDSVGWCYVGADGYCVTNAWMADSVGWCYLDSEGRMATNQWIMDSVGWCYVGADGYCVTNCWVQDSVGWCYLDADGRMVYNQWVQDSVGWCYVGADGYMVYNCWIGNDYIGADGYWVA